MQCHRAISSGRVILYHEYQTKPGEPAGIDAFKAPVTAASGCGGAMARTAGGFDKWQILKKKF